MNKEPAKSGFEQDAITPWRHWLCYMRRSKVRKKAKKQMNRRFRRRKDYE